jgi:hypothetical protein
MCALKYAVAVADPFSQGAIGACVPFASAMTQKVTSFLHGTAYIGTQGIGFISICPALANNVPSFYFTDATFAGNDVGVLSAASTTEVGVNRALVANLPYPAADFIGGNDRANANGRIVSAGMKMWYTGTAIAMSGVTYCFREPNHGNAGAIGLTRTTAATLGTRRETFIDNLDRRECTLVDFACDATEQQITTFDAEEKSAAAASTTDTVYPFSRGDGSYFTAAAVGVVDLVAAVNVGHATGLILFTGTAGQSVQFTYVVHAEFSGVRAAAVSTRTDADIEGAQLVLAAGTSISADSQHAKTKSAWGVMYDSLSTMARKAAEVAVPRAMEAALSIVL